MNILFTVAYLDGYHGSVFHVKELAEYLASEKGGKHNVMVGSIFITQETEQMFKTGGLNISLLGNIDLSVTYDVIFAYHFPTIEMLLKRGIKCRKMVLGTLSGYELLETLPNFYKNASLIFAMSNESKNNHADLYGIPSNKIKVLENCIPDKFVDFQSKRELAEEIPKRIAVVSNHVPKELYDIGKYLPTCIDVTYFGMGTESYQEITPEVLAEYDVIITIGKTVQYAMGLGIPVFEYDHFGGNGYITPQNMESEAITNFSGRSTQRKLSAEELAKEIIECYPKVQWQTYILRKLAIERFLLSKRVDELMCTILKSPDFSYDFSKIEYNAELDFAHGEAFCNWTGALKSENFILKQELVKTKQEIDTLSERMKLNVDKLNKDVDILTEHIDAIKNTRGYKLLEFLRMIKRKLTFK